MSDVLFSGGVNHLPGERGESGLLLRRLARPGRPVLYIHGATFPSALSVGYRFAGRSWMDDLVDRGFDAWGFDFAGYGGSDRPTGFAQPAEGQEPIGRAADCSRQIARVVDHILAATGHRRIALIAHSWGSIPAALFATMRPDLVERIVLFGAIAARQGAAASNTRIGWRLVSVTQQLARFIEDVPRGHPSILIEPELAQWGPAYLATDRNAATRQPEPSVQIPFGPSADIAAAWSGEMAYDPARVIAPTLIAHGEWDHLCDDADARWFKAHFGARDIRDAKIPKGTHLMHLEHSRIDLFAATNSFLLEEISQ